MKIIRRLYDWMGSKVGSRWADAWLAALFFIESSVFIIPVDPLLMLYCIKRQRKAWYYAAVATMASVVGGLFGYFIGAVMWQTVGTWIVHHLISPTVFQGVVARYQQYEAWAVFIAAFTPVPYKAVTISAGFCRLDVLQFVLFSFLGRGLRFFLLGGLIYRFGAQVQALVDRYFNVLVVLFMCILFMSVKIIL